MIYPRKRGATSVMIRVFIPNNSVTTGAGLTGLTNVSTNLTIAYIRELDSASTSYTGANIEAQTTIGTFQAPSTSAKIRFKVVDATNFPGVYELQFHDSSTAFGTGDTSQHISINIYEASTTALLIGPNMIQIPLVPWDPTDSVRMGLTALPNAAAGASGGVPLSADASGRVDVLKINGTSQTARDIGANVLLSSGAGTGQLDFTSGVVKSNYVQILGATVATPATAGIIDVNVKNMNNVAATAITTIKAVQGLTTADTIVNLTNAPTAGDFTSTMKASLNVAIPSVTVSDKTGFSLIAGYDPAKTAAQAGDAMTLTAAYDAAKTALQAGGNVVATNMRGTDNALLAVNYTAPDNADVALIKAKTDSLTFTVAGQVDANIQRINDVTITGNGQPGTEFGV